MNCGECKFLYSCATKRGDYCARCDEEDAARLDSAVATGSRDGRSHNGHEPRPVDDYVDQWAKVNARRVKLPYVRRIEAHGDRPFDPPHADVLANFRLAHEIVASMADGPRVRAADDADTIIKRMREIHLAEGRRPISCPPGQHNFEFSCGVYTCTVCGRGKAEDGR